MEETHINHVVPNTVASATAFTLSGGLPGTMDARPSAASPIIRAQLDVSAMGAPAGGSAVPLSGGDPITDPTNARPNAIHPVLASAQDVTTRQFAIGNGRQEPQGDTDALELWLRIRGKDGSSAAL